MLKASVYKTFIVVLLFLASRPTRSGTRQIFEYQTYLVGSWHSATLTMQPMLLVSRDGLGALRLRTDEESFYLQETLRNTNACIDRLTAHAVVTLAQKVQHCEMV